MAQILKQRKLKNDKVKLMNNMTSDKTSPKRAFLASTAAATALAFVAKPFKVLSSSKSENAETVSKRGKLTAVPNSDAVARRKK